VTSIVLISKSDNQNQVHYGIRLDARCQPVGAGPVYAYWRMLERGPAVLEPLLAREEPLYGVRGTPQRVHTEDARSTVQIRIGAIRDRVVEVRVWPTAGRCEAIAVTSIADLPAQVWNAHIATRWPAGVSHVLLQGWTLDTRRAVNETIRP